MAHQQQIDFCKSVKQQFPHFFHNRLVLDIGSLDINGNNQYLFDDCLYLGVDLLPGKNVDLTTKGHELSLPDENVDVIVSTECFEHDQFYALTLKNIIRMLKPGGLFLFSCATTGRPEHGTRRTTPADAPFTQEFGEWSDYYKNLEEGDIRRVLDIDAIFKNYAFSIGIETCDLYFWGIKKGTVNTRYDYSFQIQQSNLRSDLRTRETFIAELLATVNKRDGQITNLNQAAAERDGQITSLNQAVIERDRQIASLNQAAAERDGQIRSLNQAAAERDGQITSLNQVVTECDMKMGILISSNSWLLTKPLRFLGRVLRGELKTAMAPFTGIRTKRVAEVLRQSKTVAEYVMRGDFDGLRKRVEKRKRFLTMTGVQRAPAGSNDQIRWGIMTTQHTLFIAHLAAEQLRALGYEVEILTAVPANFHDDFYLVICPQMFEKLPPGEKRIALQMEQSVSSRWFTNQYIETLNNSLAVLEYSLVNIDFLASKGVAYPQVHYLPVGASVSYGNSIIDTGKSYDILFYGDSNSSQRRREMLEALMQNYNVRVVTEVFGHDMQFAIKQARLVINLHYYENALLEMPRIQECLSLGVPVVSEAAQDQADYPELGQAVSFFKQGSIPAMLKAVKDALEYPVTELAITESVARSAQRFTFMFNRFLVAMNYLSAEHVGQMSLPLPSFVDRVALSLPETIARRQVFETVRPANCVVFDGIRRRPGWTGCGLSYMALAQHAIKHGLKRLNVMEDDVLLPSDFEFKMAVVHEFLDLRSGKWDVFSGLIAVMHPDVKILAVEIFKDITFVTINKMTSMVFNIYGEKVMRLLASWDPENLDPVSNTIDRFLESQTDLRVVVAVPFFVGHREEVFSTLWGFQNTQYNEMIATSERSLMDMIATMNSGDL